ncbi:MAG: N-formylglutamate amidohydrolase [uncultured Sulfurovum sp.]|uniref:N-formylglutamate amidohydrolase n=1 Tax=uncultured Sulfurovum sp. TaxID=269237 RepID=A0A6S6T0S6_9BACT|nr:MAG: N-formylglutamate amidohydrolase [uncultured Sulfurovum sp.]
MSDIKIKNEDSPYIFSFPHSGELLTSEMEWQLTPKAWEFLPNTDWYLNELYSFLKYYKVNMISTPHSRYVVDVNRSLTANKFGNYRDSIVYETNSWDEEIYALKPTSEEVERRIERYYKPYHEALEALIIEKVKKFGKVYLIDLHAFMGPITADVCLGNRNGTTCSNAFFTQIFDAFKSENFDVVKNDVFIGGYITQSYAVEEVVESVQIELGYSNYIEASELNVPKVPQKNTTLFYETADRLERVIQALGIEKKDKSLFGGMFG